MKVHLQEVNNPVVKAGELLLCCEIEGDYYRAIKPECKGKNQSAGTKIKDGCKFPNNG